VNVLLLSNGPSLAEFDGNMQLYDCVIAVTGAATKFPCHWWVVGDDQVFDLIDDVKGNPPFVFLNKSISIHKGADYMRYAREWLKSRVYVLRWSSVENARGYSGPAALALARYCLTVADPAETHIIDVYGVDMEGNGDCRSDDDNGHRDDGRWERERRQWNALVELIESEGNDVRQHRTPVPAR